MSNVNNTNYARMNELLSKIGTKNKSLVNKLTRKTSKSTEFLDILERKISKVKNDVNLSNIEKKIAELEKIFLKFKNFSDKIKNKNDINLKNRYKTIYDGALFFTCPNLSIQILRMMIDPSTITSVELKKLEIMQNKLIYLFINHYDIKNEKNNIELINMNRILDQIRENIELRYHKPNNNTTKHKNLSNQLSQLQIQTYKNNNKKLQNAINSRKPQNM